MGRSDRGHIPDPIQVTFTVASFFAYLATLLGLMLAALITFVLVLVALRLRVRFLDRVQPSRGRVSAYVRLDRGGNYS